MTVPAYWIRSTNVGDCLTPFILSRLLNQQVEWSDKSPKWIAAGSILQEARSGDVLCGVGSFKETDAPSGKDVRVVTLRGPLTAARIGIKLPVYGDAGLLLPGLYWKPVPISYTWGIIPHYVDPQSIELPDRSMRTISVGLSVPEFIDAVRSCRQIASSSLHGLVIAEAYGIPAVRIRFPTSDAIRDFDYKHRDYFEGTERPLPPAVELADALTGKQKPAAKIVNHTILLGQYVREELKNL